MPSVRCHQVQSLLIRHQSIILAYVAQWIEHRSPKAGVGGPIPLMGTTAPYGGKSVQGAAYYSTTAPEWNDTGDTSWMHTMSACCKRIEGSSGCESRCGAVIASVAQMDRATDF